ncbi:MAG: NACHT domain-containing protein, partial [Acetobacteraceae bacterium]
MRTVLDDGRAFLLLDGVDEVPNNRRSEIRAAIRGIAKQYAKSWIVVTTRPTAVAEGWLRADGFAEAEINPLSEPDRAELIRRWHQAVAEELRLQGRPQDLALLADNLITELSGAPALARLAANPLLCAVICALHRDRREVLPESQGELCEAICSLLLHRREAEAGISLAEFPVEYSTLSYKQKRAILQSIAHHMADNQESSITEAAAIARTKAALRRFPGVDESDAPAAAKALVERSGMLRERRAGVIDFAHNTLRDYLAAEIFVEDDDVAKLARNAADDAWRQVVRFAAANDNRKFATELIERILAEADQAGPALARRLRVAALDCRHAALNVDPATVARVHEVESALVPPQTMEDAEALAGGGDAVVPFLRYRTMPPECAAASVRALRLIGTPQARQVLTEYYAERRAPVIDELCQAVNPLLLDFVREQLASDRGLEGAVARQITDLEPLDGMTGLKYLDLSGCTAISDLGPIRTLKNLKWLILPRARISDLSPVTTLPSLQSLALDAPEAKHLALLSTCPALTSLYLSKLTDEAVPSLTRLSRLDDLTITQSTLTDWAALACLNSLRGLAIFVSNVTTVAWLPGFARLTRLTVLDCDVEDPGPIADLPNLQRLALSGDRL